MIEIRRAGTGQACRLSSAAAAYALEMLSDDERRRFERHAQDCPDCREAVQRDRRLGRLVRLTLLDAGRPPAGRLEQLMPVPPQARARRSLSAPHRPSFALAGLLAVLLFVLSAAIVLPALRRGTTPGAQPVVTATQHAATATRAPYATATVEHTQTASGEIAAGYSGAATVAEAYGGGYEPSDPEPGSFSTPVAAIVIRSPMMGAP